MIQNRFPKKRSLFATAGVIFFFCSCTPSSPPASSKALFQSPTKDEIALVDQQPLTLHQFLSVRETLSTLDRETVLWITLSGVAITQSSKLSFEEGCFVALYSIEKQPFESVKTQVISFLNAVQHSFSKTPSAIEVRKEIEALLSKKKIIRNDQILAELK